jgi:aromatic ring-opening dioxygenase LigB subunit
MARIVGVYGVGHGPQLINAWDQAGSETCAQLTAAFEELRRRINSLQPTTVVTISNDHFNNFMLNNFPAYAVGVGDGWTGPEDDLRFERGQVRIPGNPALGRHIVQHLYEHEDFDPSASHSLKLDHGTFVPVRFGWPEFDLPVVPTFQNCVQKPLPTMRRAAAFGAALRHAIESYEGEERVVVIGAGGMSHFIGVPGQGRINEEFDQLWVRLFQHGDLEALAAMRQADIDPGGNGADEIRNWVSAMGAAEGGPAEWLFYKPVPAWFIGMGLVDFHYQSR